MLHGSFLGVEHRILDQRHRQFPLWHQESRPCPCFWWSKNPFSPSGSVPSRLKIWKDKGKHKATYSQIMSWLPLFLSNFPRIQSTTKRLVWDYSSTLTTIHIIGLAGWQTQRCKSERAFYQFAQWKGRFAHFTDLGTGCAFRQSQPRQILKWSVVNNWPCSQSCRNEVTFKLTGSIAPGLGHHIQAISDESLSLPSFSKVFLSTFGKSGGQCMCF